MRHATATLVAGLMRKEAFAGASLGEAMNGYVISPTLAARTTGVHCSHAARLLSPDLLEIRYTTRVDGLGGPYALKHVYTFPLRNEVWQTAAVVHPESPECTSAVLVALAEHGPGYVNVAVNDDENYMIRTAVLSYNRYGDVRPYTPLVPDKFSSPLPLGKAELGETVDERGRRVLRLALELAGLDEPTTVKVGYCSLGIHRVGRFDVVPADPVVTSDLLLDDNPELLPGEWVVAATDAQNRMLVNGIVRLSPRDGTAVEIATGEVAP
jgi:hypothetical protein